MINAGGDLGFVEHVGTRGMKWGVRKTPSERAARDKVKAKKKAIKKEFKKASKLTAGEVVASALIAGPIGVIGMKAFKSHNAAISTLNNNDLTENERRAAASNIKVGRAVAATVLAGPIGLVAYAGAKIWTGNRVDD